MTTIGGTGIKDDNSLKVSCNIDKVDEYRYVTPNDITIESPFEDKIQSITLDICHGEVVNVHVRYFRDDAESRIKDKLDPTWSETYLINNLKLEFQSSKRVFYADGIRGEDGTGYDEASRNKILGVKE